MGRSSTPPLTHEEGESGASTDAPLHAPVARLLLPPRPRAVAARAANAVPRAVSAPASNEPSAHVAEPEAAARHSVAADAETVLPPAVRAVPPPLPSRALVSASDGDDTIDAEDDDETPTGSDLSLPDLSFPRRMYGPVVDLSRPTVTDLDQPPPLPVALVPKARHPVAIARRPPVVLNAAAVNDSVLTRQLARRPVSMPSMPLALMKPHVRIAKSLAHDVRSSKREIVIGLSIGLMLAAPLFIAGHLYLLHRSAPHAAVQPPARAPAGGERAALPRPRAVAPRVAPPPVAPELLGVEGLAPERIQQAVAGLEPAALPRRAVTLERAAASQRAGAEAMTATLAPKPARRRPKPSAPPPRPAVVAAEPSAQNVEADEPELSPAERAGLTTTIPF
jgi:hypothetical protein